MKKNPYVFLLLAPFMAILLVAIQVYYTAAVWRYSGEDVVFEIKPNETFGSINARLKQEKLVASARFFHRYSQYQGTMTKFKSGKFLIRHKSNLLDVYSTLLSGKSIANLITIPEGQNMYQIAQIFEARNITSAVDFLKLAKDIDFIERLGVKSHTIEGYLYPETYDFAENISAELVISSMVKEFNKKTANLDFSKSKLTKEEIVTLASVVEKETGVGYERPIIAGVFLNRLNKRMRLQSDPTTIYGMWERYDGNIRKKDLSTHSDYNTYTVPRLPKGPIANPGIEAISAVLNPAIHNYYFFVSKNDGTHIFTEKYSQHRQAVDEWQKNPKNRLGKSWRDLNMSNSQPAIEATK